MNDTIYRSRAIDTVNIARKRCDTNSIDDYHALVVAALESLPVAKPTGKWEYIMTPDANGYCLQCPFCGRKFFKKSRADWNEPLSFNYCPHCGAPMEGLQ